MVIPAVLEEMPAEVLEAESAEEAVPAENVQDFLSGKTDSPFKEEGSLEGDNKVPQVDHAAVDEKLETNKIDPSSAEGKIYSDAGVDLENPKTENLQGQEYTVYELEIDPELEGPDGRTNRERMANGEAPYVDRNGKLERVELHHNEQQNDTLVELDQSTHRTNNEVLHPKRGEGEGRGHDPDWDAKRKEHWQNRAKDFEK